MKKIVLITGGVAILIIAAAIFLPIYNGAVCNLNPEKTCVGRLVNLIDYLKHRRDIKIANFLSQMQLSRMTFPETIGDYAMAPGNYYTTNDCIDFEKNKICLNNIHVMYKNKTTNEIVDLTFINVIAGRGVFFTQQQKFFESAQLEGYDVGYTQNERFSWFPRNDFDMIVAYEESLDKNQVGGTNLVTVYFLDKYSPNNRVANGLR